VCEPGHLHWRPPKIRASRNVDLRVAVGMLVQAVEIRRRQIHPRHQDIHLPSMHVPWKIMIPSCYNLNFCKKVHQLKNIFSLIHLHWRILGGFHSTFCCEIYQLKFHKPQYFCVSATHNHTCAWRDFFALGQKSASIYFQR